MHVSRHIELLRSELTGYCVELVEALNVWISISINSTVHDVNLSMGMGVVWGRVVSVVDAVVVVVV